MYNPQFKPNLLHLAIMTCALSLGACNSDSKHSSTPGNPDDDENSSTIALSGTVVASADDADAVASLSERTLQWIVQMNPVTKAWAAEDTGAAGNVPLQGATVELVKVLADGSETPVDIGTVTTDSNGQFTIPDVPPAPEGSGADTDFYYEVRISKDDLELRAPAAPTADDSVNVSPESNLAADMLSDVIDVPGVDNPPLPGAATIEALREQVVKDAADLVDDGAIALPSATGDNSSTLSLAMANGLAAAGGNAEQMMKTASFESEYLALTGSDSTTDAQAGGYVKRLLREACGQSDGDYIPQSVADALGAYLNDDNDTLTLSQFVSAYNANNGANPDTDLNAVIGTLQDAIDAAQSNRQAGAGTATDIDNTQRLALFARPDGLGELNADTPLRIDQAYLLVQVLGGGGPSACNIATTLDLPGFVSDLTDNSAVAEPSIADFQIYHNSGFGCDEGAGQGHFYAQVDVYAGNKTVTGVTISSSDTNSLDGDGVVSLGTGGPGGGYTSDDTGVCVDLATPVTYTITATFSDSSTATRTVSRNHPRIPEASSQVLVGETFVAGSPDTGTPTVVTTSRPLYQWTAPATLLDNIIADATNNPIQSALAAATIGVKYTYEFAHVRTDSGPVSPLPQCDQVSAGALYAVDSFIPTVDCDVNACATAVGTDPGNIVCRMNIQTFLVDENDNRLGQSAGHFRSFCVDTNSDSDCGE